MKGIGEIGSPWLTKQVVCHGLSSLNFIPPVMERECIRLPVVLRAIATPYALSYITGVGSLGYISQILSVVFQVQAHEFRILPGSKSTRRKSKATITPQVVVGKCVSFSRH